MEIPLWITGAILALYVVSFAVQQTALAVCAPNISWTFCTLKLAALPITTSVASMRVLLFWCAYIACKIVLPYLPDVAVRYLAHTVSVLALLAAFGVALCQGALITWNARSTQRARTFVALINTDVTRIYKHVYHGADLDAYLSDDDSDYEPDGIAPPSEDESLTADDASWELQIVDNQ